ncbi:MAG: peptide chain release factor N(5)-glutamine methyltransferase [Alphaproteobacteria bacterium]|nr:peptide chain release factor N(5)-glutamine methyltransferase [Alphaproteobacteria bacterium]
MNGVPLQPLIDDAVAKLSAAGIKDPLVNVHVLAAHALGISQTSLLRKKDRLLADDEASRIRGLIERRAKRQTYARIVGTGDFFGLPFDLNEATIEPRPDTETLIFAALAKKNLPFRLFHRRSLRILDLGTGSGCLLLTLLHALPYASGVGVDIAPRAVEQARANAKKLGLAKRASFRTGNWDEGIEEKFDIVVSNPPYVPTEEILKLTPAIRDHEPHAALDGGKDGMAFYRSMIPGLPQRLKNGGLLVLEIGFTQGYEIKYLLRKAGFSDIEVHRDAGEFDRCIDATWKEGARPPGLETRLGE